MVTARARSRASSSRPSSTGQAAVDDHHVVLPGEPEVQAPLPVVRRFGLVAFVREQLGEHARQFPVVFDEQHSRFRRRIVHEPILAVIFRN